jgi:hypothetical protein
VFDIKFEVRKSVHHHTIQINQLDATIYPVYYLTFTYSLRSHAHHQELNNCSSSLWFYLRSVVIAVLLVVVVPVMNGRDRLGYGGIGGRLGSV